MVHVSDAGGRHKMLAFSTEPNINTISIKEEGILTNINLNGAATTTNTITNTITNSASITNSNSPGHNSNNGHSPGSRDINKSPTNTLINLTNLSIITEESPFTMNNMLDDGSNGNTDTDIEIENNGNNGNVSFVTSETLENFDSDDAETHSLLIGDKSHGSQTSNNSSDNNKVFTEEILVISNNSNSTGKRMSTCKTTTTTTTSSSSTTTNNATSNGKINSSGFSKVSKKEWQSSLSESQSNESEESPLLAAEAETTSIDTNMSTPTNPTVNISNDTPGSVNASPSVITATTTTNVSSSTNPTQGKHSKLTNGTKHAGLKRVSFGSSKGSMVETLIYESPVSEEPEIVKTGNGVNLTNGTIKSANSSNDPNDSLDSTASGGSTGGSRPPSRVRVTFFESEKPSLAVSSPESDILDFDLSNMTLPGSPNAVDRTPPAYNRQMSTESGWDNPFRPDGDLSKEADQIVELIKEGKPINDETLRSKSPSVNETINSVSYPNMLNASPKGKGANGSAPNGAGGSGSVEVQHGVVAPAATSGQVEHVVLKKKKGCCVIQ